MIRVLILLLTALLALTNNCSKSSESGDSGDSTSSTTSSANSITLVVSNYSLSLSESTTITVSGGTGSYVSATATQGSIYASSSNSYVYTSPPSISDSSVTVTITDSDGNTGVAYLSISGSSSDSTSTITSCAGTYTASMNGISAKVYIVSDADENIAGYIYMTNYYYPISGYCSVSSGSISFRELSIGNYYTGSISTNSSSQLTISGNIQTSSSNYSWSATSSTTVTTTTNQSYSCEGQYSATIAGNSGTLLLVSDGSYNVAGYLYLQGYYYAFKGTCDTSSGSVSMSNLTTSSTYTGSAYESGSTKYLSGSFQLSSGTTYSWSANSQ